MTACAKRFDSCASPLAGRYLAGPTNRMISPRTFMRLQGDIRVRASASKGLAPDRLPTGLR